MPLIVSNLVLLIIPFVSANPLTIEPGVLKKGDGTENARRNDVRREGIAAGSTFHCGGRGKEGTKAIGPRANR